MSKTGATLYVVNLHHLSSDCKKAGTDLSDAQLTYIPAKQLRNLLDSLAALGPGVVFPVEPELRITAPDGKFAVKLKGGKLQLTSWSSAHKGGEYTAARIYSIITGEEAEEMARQQEGGGVESSGGGGGGGSKVMLLLLAVAIVAVNCFTVWFVTRPKKTLLPKYTLLAPEPAERVLANVAGVYETGTSPGDRRIEIDKTGSVQRYKFGADRTQLDKQHFTVKAAEAGGKPALLTSRKSMITIKDQLSVILYGDTYQRVTR